MRRIMSGLLFCLLLTGCTVGIVTRQEFAPTSPLLAPGSTPTEDPRVAMYVGATVAVLKLAATPTGTPLATLVPTPTLTLTSTPAPRSAPVSPRPTTPRLPVIQSFTASATDINPGASVSLMWTTTGATRVVLARETASGDGEFQQDVPLNGSLVVGSRDAGNHWHRYYLFVYNEGNSTSSEIAVRVRCQYSFFFNTTSWTTSWLCPGGPAQSFQAAEQTFEGGRMIWLKQAAPIRQWEWGPGSDKDSFVILALYSRGAEAYQWQTFIDAWTPGEPDSDPSIAPPDGRLQPIRGFGKVWRTHPQVREWLGWALTGEQGYNASYQQVSGLGQGDVCFYLNLFNGSVVRLCRQGKTWDYAP